MQINYYINIAKKYIIETWPEKVSIEDYILVKQNEFNDPDFNPDYNVITDLRNLKQKFDEETITKIIKFIFEHKGEIRNRKSAVIATNPQAVASSYFFQNKSIDSPINVQVFSTIEAALAWFKF